MDQKSRIYEKLSSITSEFLMETKRFLVSDEAEVLAAFSSRKSNPLLV